MDINYRLKELNNIYLSDIDKGYKMNEVKLKKRKGTKIEIDKTNPLNPYRMEELTQKIYNLALENNISHLSKWQDIDLSNLSEIKKYDNWELEDMLKELKIVIKNKALLGIQNQELQHDNEDIYIDSLEIIQKYKYGNPYTKENQSDETYTIENSQWHLLLSKNIKIKINTWATENIDTFYDKAKDLLNREPKNNELRILISELSELIYERDEISSLKQEIERVTELESDENHLVELILFRVESIVQPHIDVIEKNIRSGGRLIFADIWNTPFNESLKNEVRERDRYKCVVCESEVDLHVHHKIPRNLGGIHHVDNLVTLCASCHSAIEQADVRVAFNKGLSNYKKNKARASLNFEMPVNKVNLNLKIEEKLDDLLNKLDVRNQDLILDVVELMTYFEKLKEL